MTKKQAKQPDWLKQTKNDAPDDFIQEMELLFHEGMKKFRTENEIAKHIKEIFESKHQGKWHCVVGKSYGSSVGYTGRGYMSKQIGIFHIELWKCG